MLAETSAFDTARQTRADVRALRYKENNFVRLARMIETHCGNGAKIMYLVNERVRLVEGQKKINEAFYKHLLNVRGKRECRPWWGPSWLLGSCLASLEVRDRLLWKFDQKQGSHRDTFRVPREQITGTRDYNLWKFIKLIQTCTETSWPESRATGNIMGLFPNMWAVIGWFWSERTQTRWTLLA